MLMYYYLLKFTYIYLEFKVDLSSEVDKRKDFKFTKWLSKNIKFQCMPFSIFFTEKDKLMAEDYVRFCFFKVIFPSIK